MTLTEVIALVGVITIFVAAAAWLIHVWTDEED